MVEKPPAERVHRSWCVQNNSPLDFYRESQFNSLEENEKMEIIRRTARFQLKMLRCNGIAGGLWVHVNSPDGTLSATD